MEVGKLLPHKLGFFAFQRNRLNFPNTASCVVRLPSHDSSPGLTVGSSAPTVTLGGWGTSPGCSLVPGHPHPQGSAGHPRPSAKPLCFSSSPIWEVVLHFQDIGWRDADLGKIDGKTMHT